MSLERFGYLTAYLLLIWHRPLKMSRTCVSVGWLINCLPANSLSARVAHSLLCFLPLVLGHFGDSHSANASIIHLPQKQVTDLSTSKTSGNKSTQTVTSHIISDNTNTSKPEYFSWNTFFYISFLVLNSSMTTKMEKLWKAVIFQWKA